MIFKQKGGIIARYTHGPGIDEPLMMNRSGAHYYYHFDSLGSVIMLTNENCNISATYEYSVYGKIRSETGEVENPYMYTSREFDSQIGLYYYRARWYDQVNGRWHYLKI
jgi:hypothetical protein